MIYVDHTHCGRHVTGLERITLELFSRDALAPLDIEILTSGSVKSMILQQTMGMPWRLAMDRDAILVCPGFPPSPLATMFGLRVLPYIHDTFLMTRPEDLNARARLYMAPSFRWAVKKLKCFLVNSQTTCDDLKRFCRADAEITLYRPDVRNVFDLAPADRGQRANASKFVRLVALGTVEPRKNLTAAAAILNELRARDFPDATLDIVGRPGWGRDADLLAQTPGVIMHGYQDADRVRSIVQDADMLITTSHDEGLGLPLLEAQYAGLPVIAPDKAVFREVLAESGLFINPARPGECADAIMQAVQSNDWRQRYVAADAANLARWSRLAAADRTNVIRLFSRLSTNWKN